MRLTSTLLVGCAALALAAAPTGRALADPPGGVTPRASDIVGVGSDTSQYLMDQFAQDYDGANPGASSLLYSWDSADPTTGVTGGPIETKATCADIARPDGSSAGISALEAGVTDPSSSGDYCVDFAGSSRGPTASDPACATGGICFVPLAGDAVTWASRDAASGGTDAPASLTRTQLKEIYTCKVTNWDQVGGADAPIEAFLPQTSSGLRATWLTALGGGTTPVKPGACVSDDANTLQDDQGINPVLDSPEAVVPYSVAGYIAQAYHDAPCAKASCTGSPACTPAPPENMFGCDRHGVLGLKEVSGSRPMLPWPPPSSACKDCRINPKFLPLFTGAVYVVVRYAATPDNIPAYLEPFFAASSAITPGWSCSSPKAQQDIKAYGLLPLAGAGAPGDSRVTGGSQCGIPHH
jgi:ABC-type phosphate transport system substrate-binding protein